MKNTIINVILIFFFLVCTADASEDADSLEPYLLPAVAQGKIEDIKLLVSKGVNINYQAPDSGIDALSLAVYVKNEAAMKLLITSGINLNLKNKLGVTALHTAIISNNIQAVKLLLSKGANSTVSSKGLTPIMLASSVGNNEVIKIFMEKGESINTTQPDGWTALMHAIAKHKLETVTFLLDSHADINAKASLDEGGPLISVLEMAQYYGDQKIINTIIEKSSTLVK